MIREEICNEYEKEIGNVIIEEFMGRNLIYCLGIIVNDYGFFIWGKDVNEVVYNVVVLEEVVKMVYYIELMSFDNIMDKVFMNKYFLRKYGKNVYYG